MIKRNEIPILEYDDSSPEVIPPDHDWTAGKLPEKCLFAFLGDVVHEYAAKHDAKVVETLITVSHDIKIYVLHEENEDICLVQSPIGAAASSQVLDTLVSCGCKKIIAVGSCGVLANLEENAFIVPIRALRAEGTSYHYLPASRYIELDETPILVIKETFEKHELPFVTCTTWSTDGFFRETKDMVKYRLEEGCLLFEADVRASEDGTPVCINGWTEKNLKLLGLSAKDYPGKELPAQTLRQSRLDGTFTMGTFEETAGLIAGYQGAKVIIDVGLPPADLKEKMFADIAEILKKTGLSKKRSYIRLQREGDIKLWKKQKCPCELMYFLPDSDIPEERTEKQAKALEICEKYNITLISMLSKTFDDRTSEMLKNKGMKPVIFAYDKLGDAFSALDKGAEMVGTNFYSARYAEKLTGKTQK